MDPYSLKSTIDTTVMAIFALSVPVVIIALFIAANYSSWKDLKEKEKREKELEEERRIKRARRRRRAGP